MCKSNRLSRYSLNKQTWSTFSRAIHPRSISMSSRFARNTKVGAYPANQKTVVQSSNTPLLAPKAKSLRQSKPSNKSSSKWRRIRAATHSRSLQASIGKGPIKRPRITSTWGHITRWHHWSWPVQKPNSSQKLWRKKCCNSMPSKSTLIRGTLRRESHARILKLQLMLSKEDPHSERNSPFLRLLLLPFQLESWVQLTLYKPNPSKLRTRLQRLLRNWCARYWFILRVDPSSRAQIPTSAAIRPLRTLMCRI